MAMISGIASLRATPSIWSTRKNCRVKARHHLDGRISYTRQYVLQQLSLASDMAPQDVLEDIDLTAETDVSQHRIMMASSCPWLHSLPQPLASKLT